LLVPYLTAFIGGPKFLNFVRRMPWAHHSFDASFFFFF
jgi:hypothetical protein